MSPTAFSFHDDGKVVNLHRIAGVVRAGRYIARGEIEALSADLATKLRR